MADTFIWTARDEYERLLATQEYKDQGRSRQLARMAILNSLRNLPNRARWSYYQRRYTLRTVASQTGTVTYDHTGGSSERLATIASMTIPTDGTGVFYRISIGNVHYDVDRVLSSTTFTLRENNNPGSDVAAGTAATLYRGRYPLPVGLRRIGQVIDCENQWPLIDLSDNEAQMQAISPFDTPGTPERFYLSSGELLSSLCIDFIPAPNQDRTYDVLYEAGAQQVNTWKYSTGTATTNGSTTVTLGGSGVTNARMVGSIIRFSADGTTEPTSLVGNLAGDDNLFVYERAILEVPTGTTLTVDTATAALSAVKYVISDPIDIEPGAMLLAFQAMCDAEYARLLMRKDVAEREAWATKLLRQAIEDDRRVPYPIAISSFDRFSNTRMTDDDS